MDQKEVSTTTVKVKKEKLDEDIHEFAETAMNELLGWYGYGATRDESKMSNCRSLPRSNSSEPESPKHSDGCDWCGKAVDETKAIASSGANFCSELCFSQSRRANFKKNKTCDWCRHVRHTVSYVDFQDGASQLQFCSDKCLNQYKMHIFCRETRAHLELHPHLPEDISGASGLITPELWLKNCKSPEPLSSPALSPKLADGFSQTSVLPLITVAHPSKFMDNVDSKRLRSSKVQKRRKRCSATITQPFKSPSESPQDLRIRHTPPPSVENLRDDSRPFSYSRPIDYRTPLLNGFPEPHKPTPIYQSQLPPPPPPPSLLPPVTVLVPYPIIIPMPLPVPIPIPIPCDRKRLEEALKKNSNSCTTSQNITESSAIGVEVLDNVKKEPEKENAVNAKKGSDGETEVITVINGNGRPFRKRKRVAVSRLGSVKNKKFVPA